MLVSATLGGTGIAVGARRGFTAGAQDATPVAGEMVGQAEAPRWTFAVLTFHDPYEGELTRPTERAPGVRYVAAEVVITNPSDQPLEFSVADIRLRDESGVEYPSNAGVIGVEPKLTGQNLPGGERTRGTVWFTPDENAAINEVRFSAPSPLLRVPVAGQ